MKKTALLIIFFSIFIFSQPCTADDTAVQHAYSLYNQGKMIEAIEVMKELAAEEPEPGKFYFIGYAYYKLQDFKSSREYFNKAYEVNSNYDVMKGEEEKDPME